MTQLLHSVGSVKRVSSQLPFARMIPGRGVGKERTAERIGVLHRDLVEHCSSRAERWLLLRWLLPRPETDNSLALYQQVFCDIVLLIVMCGLPSLIWKGWCPEWPNIAIYPAVVTLYGFSEGLYRKGQTYGPSVPVLIRSVTVPMLLLLLTEWKDLRIPAAVSMVAMSAAGLVLSRKFFEWQRIKGEELHNVLIVGATPAGRAIAKSLREDTSRRLEVRGFVDDRAPLSPEVLGRVEDLDWLTRSEFIDEVIVAMPGENALAREAAQTAYRNHLDLRVVPDLPPGFWPDANVERIGNVPVVTLHREPAPAWKLFLKRCVDAVGGMAGLVLALPVMAAVAIAIRLESGGPIFYSALRAGMKGRPFPCYKFRSMTVDADKKKESLRGRNQRNGPIFKLENDPRVTRVGRFIRRYSLDELPQLWNVLGGEMSLVGPRPHPVEEVNRYELHHFRRLDMKPGLTGLWQVTARKNPSFDLNMHLDLTYIENWTLLLDFRILANTLRVLFVPEGA